MSKIGWNIGETQFLGRNGYFKCNGFECEKIDSVNEPGETWEEKVIRVYPVTSKGRRGRCFIEIPQSLVGRFVQTLEAEMLKG